MVVVGFQAQPSRDKVYFRKAQMGLDLYQQVNVRLNKDDQL
jgi:hypothetical protein